MNTPDARAAGLFLSAFNVAFEDDERMTISVHTNGGTVSVEGHLSSSNIMTFHVEDVAFLLDRLTHLLSKDKPLGSITVTVPNHKGRGALISAWAWSLTGGTDGSTEALDPEVAVMLLPESAEFPQPDAVIGNGTFTSPPSAAMDAATLNELRRRGLTITEANFG
ncbi:hypothetical protein [Streptomyces roseochromogenus]|uniref:hypothetical protein n=1 Tax=Streptomyces roseochromogenus TaxID=285450 RepID=UPI001319BCC2|nr:hypothetical protein [Streptomyces roseochromogenus]